MIENSTLRVGGNTLKVWLGEWIENAGKFLQNWGTKVVMRNKPRLVTNPSAKLCNPFTLLISFTVDTSHKYQIVLQGDYKDKYKEAQEGDINLTENELFMIINQNAQNWYKKE